MLLRIAIAAGVLIRTDSKILVYLKSNAATRCDLRQFICCIAIKRFVRILKKFGHRAITAHAEHLSFGLQQRLFMSILLETMRMNRAEVFLFDEFLMGVVLSPLEKVANKLKAVDMLLDRGWGRPKEIVEVAVTANGLVDIPLEQLLAMVVEGEWREEPPLTAAPIEIEASAP